MNCRSDKVLPLAICGFGRFASKRLLPAVSGCQNVRLVSAIEDKSDKLNVPGNIHLFDSLDNFIASKPTGAVYIATPNYLHADNTLRCLAAGLHVLCEKPMAINSDDCRKMMDAAAGQKVHLQVGHMLRYSPAIKMAKDWLNEGVVGELLSIDTIFHYDLPFDSRPWAFDRKKSGGGALMDAGIHCIDTVRYLVGDPVVPKTVILDRPVGSGFVEKSIFSFFEVNDVSCAMHVCSNAPYHSRLTLIGTKGQIVLHNFAAGWGIASVELYDDSSDEAVRHEDLDVSFVYRDQLQNFVDSILLGKFETMQSLDACENVKILETFYKISCV